MAEYIEREALIDDIDAAMDNGGMGYVIGQTLKRYVKRQPTVDVAPVVHAHWKNLGVSVDGKRIYECTNCHSHIYGTGNFCKECGAQMDEEVKDDNRP